jgi:PhzF family phenazine biosynthesis protein
MPPIFLVDAFTDRAFAGNPAGVMLLERDMPDDFLGRVAMEMKHSETAFLWPAGPGRWRLRWFTPTMIEVDLCGHATLAAAHVLFQTGRLAADQPATFESRSGVLTAERLPDGMIALDFPADDPVKIEGMQVLGEALGEWPRSTWRGVSDILVELPDAEAVRSLDPDFELIKSIDARGIIATARSDDDRYDIITRFFGPAVGIDEDPVTGSAHCTLGPFWARRLGKTNLLSFQASPRGGFVSVSLEGQRVKLAGHAVTIFAGDWQAT